jgi:uncharacterized protein (DUF427 family)
MRHRVEVVPSGHRVRVALAGEAIAESERVLELRETGYRMRCYLPLEDVREGVLEPSDKTSHCPFKGDASYFSVRVGGELHEDVAWTYPHPIPAVAEIAGHLCFYDDRVELTVEPPASSAPPPPPRSSRA